MLPGRRLLLLLLLSASMTKGQGVPPNPSKVLRGEIRASQNNTYIRVPFSVPAGVHRITVYFQYTGKEQKTTLDLGIFDPDRFRGASGGDKDHFTIGESDATPSYLPGAIPPGEWKLLVAVPNIRAGVTAQYSAEIYFNRQIDDSSFTEHPLKSSAGWYRGDLHMHTGQSDGKCPSKTGRTVPCPVFVTVQAAANAGLDFIAVTDHNTTSQYDSLRELQPYFDNMLLIPGRELTTFHGHANMLGATQFVDYRVGTPGVPDTNAMVESARELGAIVSINHAEAPTGEACMGCGWNPTPPVNMDLITAIEVNNGGRLSSVPFWENQLKQGYRLTAVGGSDNHDAERPLNGQYSIGMPTTVIWARELSVAGILDGIRSGRVFVDLTRSKDKVLDFEARTADSSALMGSRLKAAKTEPVSLSAHVAGCKGAFLQIFVDGKSSPDLHALPIPGSDETLKATWKSDGSQHWIRAEVHDAQGRLLLLGNPIYINYAR